MLEVKGHIKFQPLSYCHEHETGALHWKVIINLCEMGGCPLASLFKIELFRELF